MQQVDPAVDGRQIYIEGARQPVLGDAFVDGAAQHVMLLHCRKPVDPVVVGVGLEILGDQAGGCFLTQLLERQHAQIAIKEQKA